MLCAPCVKRCIANDYCHLRGGDTGCRCSYYSSLFTDIVEVRCYSDYFHAGIIEVFHAGLVAAIVFIQVSYMYFIQDCSDCFRAGIVEAAARVASSDDRSGRVRISRQYIGGVVVVTDRSRSARDRVATGHRQRAPAGCRSLPLQTHRQALATTRLRRAAPR